VSLRKFLFYFLEIVVVVILVFIISQRNIGHPFEWGYYRQTGTLGILLIFAPDILFARRDSSEFGFFEKLNISLDSSLKIFLKICGFVLLFLSAFWL